MLYAYEAESIGFDDSDDAFTVGFGGPPDESNHPIVSLLLQRSTDEDDDPSGAEGVYAEWCDQVNACYGCIESVVLERRSVRIRFSGDASFVADMDGDEGEENPLTELLITFNIDEAEYEELKHHLSKTIFRGCAYFTAVV